MRYINLRFTYLLTTTFYWESSTLLASSHMAGRAP